ncbi:TPA: hypothetical protein DD455_01675 [Candidatus Shapirobacteria bacterium]|nr:hypothetical protein [Candidatus Shapirobacteria bacterium]
MCQIGSTECLLCADTVSPVRLIPPFEPRRPCHPSPTIAEQLYSISQEDQSPPAIRSKATDNQTVL